MGWELGLQPLPLQLPFLWALFLGGVGFVWAVSAVGSGLCWGPVEGYLGDGGDVGGSVGLVEWPLFELEMTAPQPHNFFGYCVHLN